MSQTYNVTFCWDRKPESVSDVIVFLNQQAHWLSFNEKLWNWLAVFLYYYSNSDIDNPYKDEFQILTSIKKSIVQIFLSPKLLTPKRLKQDLNCGVNVVVLRTLNF